MNRILIIGFFIGWMLAAGMGGYLYAWHDMRYVLKEMVEEGK